MSRQDDINHQLNILNIHRRNLQHLLQQRAIQGVNTPQGTLTQIDMTRDSIVNTKAALKHYGVSVEDVPGIDTDIASTVTITLPIDVYKEIKDIVEKYGITLPEIT